ncbi:MAG: hypothetical protein SO314_04070 [Alphaproteobacteria bacterium]|nr:hypothetical protein [Alphaproteobacteria bacterium]
MNDKSSNSNLEWKKTGFDFNEKLTLKTNVAKAVAESRKDKNSGLRRFTPGNISLPNGISKIRKRIKSVYDEDDEDEDSYYSSVNIQMFHSFDDTKENSSLMGALADEEKQIIRRQETQNMMSLNQETGKINALLQANQLMKENGMKGLDKKVMAQNFQELTVNTDFTSKAINEDLRKKLKLTGRMIKDEKALKLLNGVKQVRMFAGEKSLEGMKVDDVANIGEKKRSAQETAKLILKKTGRVDIKGKTIKNPQKTIGKDKKKEAEIAGQMKKNVRWSDIQK